MKVFLDVGAHAGQTLQVALCWPFDRIFCFEPAAEHLPALRKMADARTTVLPFGLWDKDAKMPLYNIGSQGASFWKRPGRPENSAECHFARASDWVREHIDHCDQVWMKLNVEGAEIDILPDLLDSGAFDRITYLQVMWDCGKIPVIAERGAKVRERVEALYGPPRVISSKMVPPADTAKGRIENWISMTGLTK